MEGGTQSLGQHLDGTDAFGLLLLALENLAVGTAADAFLEVDYVAVYLLERHTCGLNIFNIIAMDYGAYSRGMEVEGLGFFWGFGGGRDLFVSESYRF